MRLTLTTLWAEILTLVFINPFILGGFLLISTIVSSHYGVLTAIRTTTKLLLRMHIILIAIETNHYLVALTDSKDPTTAEWRVLLAASMAYKAAGYTFVATLVYELYCARGRLRRMKRAPAFANAIFAANAAFVTMLCTLEDVGHEDWAYIKALPGTMIRAVPRLVYRYISEGGRIYDTAYLEQYGKGKANRTVLELLG